MKMARSAFASLAQCLPERATDEPDRIAYIFLQADGTEQHISYRQLYTDALTYARTLQQVNIQPGDLVLLVFEHGYEVVAAFWGAIHLGAVPTVLPYFNAGPTPEVYQTPLLSLTEFAGAKVVLTMAEFVLPLQTWVSGTDALVITKSLCRENESEDCSPTLRHGEDLACLQLTTGSTGASKGAMISHRAILTRMASLATTFGIRPDDVLVYWWPLYQTAGLQNVVISPVVLDCVVVSMSPRQWTHYPHLYLQAIHRFRGTCSILPNSGLMHCVRNVRDQDLQDVDLSSWRILGVGGETVQQESLRAFVERFTPYSFSAIALKPYYVGTEYGQISVSRTSEGCQVDWVSRAELDASGHAVPQPPYIERAKPIVSCGALAPEVEVAILDEEGNRLQERRIGEIIVRSPMLFNGYYHRPDLTARVLRDGWVYTGDLGYLAEGQLYLCDRKKDVIIIGGRNVYALDLEATAEKLLGKTCNGTVAFGVPDNALGTERPVLVVEAAQPLSEPDHKKLIQRIRHQVFHLHGVALADVRFVENGWIVKTSKVSRNANRQKYLACGFRPTVGQLQTDLREEASAAEASAILSLAELTQVVTELFTGALGAPSIGQDESFFESGGDSLAFVNFLMALENRLGRSLPVEELAEHPTIAGMVEALSCTPAPRLSVGPVYYERLAPFAVVKQVLADPNLSAAEKWRRVRELLRIRLTDTGPRVFGYTLPYALGVPVLEMLCRQTGLMRGLFQKRARIVRHGLAALGDNLDEEAVFRQHLRTHLWMHWRLAALAQCSRVEFDRWVTMHGVENLQRALRRGGGVVLPLSHLGPYHFSMLLLRHLGVNNFMVVGAQPPIGAVLDFLGLGSLKDRHLFSVSHRDHRRASQLSTGQQLLRRGGVVLISGDGYQGKLPFLLPFCGRQRRFGVGFAELAARTGASVIPIFYRVTLEGRLAVEFLDPLEVSGEAHEDKVARLVQQYVTLLEQRWCDDLGSVRFYQLEWFLDPSMAARSNALFAEKSGHAEHAFMEEV